MKENYQNDDQQTSANKETGIKMYIEDFPWIIHQINLIK